MWYRMEDCFICKGSGAIEIHQHYSVLVDFDTEEFEPMFTTETCFNCGGTGEVRVYEDKIC